MPHPLVDQLRFTRSELRRCLEGVSEEEGRRRLLPSNSLGWIVGHLASQEQLLWLDIAQGLRPRPELEALLWGRPASTPRWSEAWEAWREVTTASDPFLDALDDEALLQPLEPRDEPAGESLGTQLQRVIYHYWFHLGEAHALRQQMGHGDLPAFVGALGREAPFRPR